MHRGALLMSTLLFACGAKGHAVDASVMNDATSEAGSDPCAGVVSSPMVGRVAWRVDGVWKCAGNLHAVYEYQAPKADFAIQLDTPDDAESMAFAVQSWTSQHLAGTYHCQPNAGVDDMLSVAFAFRSGSATPAKVKSCTVSLDSPGTVGDTTARGSFSATGEDLNGNIQTVSDGTFDTATIL